VNPSGKNPAQKMSTANGNMVGSMMRFARLGCVKEQDGSTGSVSNSAAWFWVAGGVAVGASLAFGFYLGKKEGQKVQQKRSERAQKVEKETDEKVKRQAVVLGDFDELNDNLIGLINDEICSLTKELKETLRKREALVKVKEEVEAQDMKRPNVFSGWRRHPQVRTVRTFLLLDFLLLSHGSSKEVQHGSRQGL
jgi:hypothetical protein